MSAESTTRASWSLWEIEIRRLTFGDYPYLANYCHHCRQNELTDKQGFANRGWSSYDLPRGEKTAACRMLLSPLSVLVHSFLLIVLTKKWSLHMLSPVILAALAQTTNRGNTPYRCVSLYRIHASISRGTNKIRIERDENQKISHCIDFIDWERLRKDENSGAHTNLQTANRNRCDNIVTNCSIQYNIICLKLHTNRFRVYPSNIHRRLCVVSTLEAGFI